MDYDDNDFQSHNVHLAGEGSTNCPPVLQPYALPKFDFDDSLQGHLRFDSLVETEVFLGIESNEPNHWIEDFSRGSSGIEFSSTAVESCSISRRNNVWSEATSSESVEMLLKSVGQEEIIPSERIFEESDACKELNCLTEQMEPNVDNDHKILSQTGNVTVLRPTLQQEETSENLSSLNDVGVDQLCVDDSQTREGKLLVDGNSNNLEPNDLSGKDTTHVSEGTPFADGKCKGVNQMELEYVVDEPPDKKVDSSASGMQVDTMISVENINTSDELSNKDVQDNLKDITEEDPDGHVLSIEAQHVNEKIVEKATCYLENPHCSSFEVESVEGGIANQENVISVEEPLNMILQEDSDLHALGECSDREISGVDADTNKCENVVLFKGIDTGGDQSEPNTQSLSPRAYENKTSCAVETSNKNAEISSSLDPVLKGDSDLQIPDGFSDRECSEVPAETNKCEDAVLLKDMGTGGDHFKLNTHDVSLMVNRGDDRYAVEVTNSNAGISSTLDPKLKVDSGWSSSKMNALESGFQPDSGTLVRTSEVSIEENDVSKYGSNENREVHCNLTATSSSSEVFSEAHVTGSSKSPCDAFGIPGEKLNAHEHASLSILEESTQMCDDNKVYGEGDVGDGPDGNLDLPSSEMDSRQLLNESNSKDLKFDGSVVKGSGSLPLCEGSTDKELIVPILTHETDGNEPAANLSLENSNLASCGTTNAAPLSSGNGVASDIVSHSEVQAAPSSAAGSHCDKKEETANEMTKDASFSCVVPPPSVETGLVSVSEAEKGVSGQSLCKTVDQSLPVTDSCNTECQNEPQNAVANEVSKRNTNEREVASDQCESSAKEGGGAEAIVFGKQDGSTIKESSEKASANVTEPIMDSDTRTGPSTLVEVCGGTAKNVMKDTDTSEVSQDKTSAEASMPSINCDTSMICEASICSASLPESHARFVAPESDLSSVGPNKTDCGPTKVVETIELSETKHESGDIKGPKNLSAPVSDSVRDGGNHSPNSWNPKGNDASKDLRNGTSDVSLFTDLPKGEAANNLQPVPAIIPPRLAEVSIQNSGSGQLDAKISQAARGASKGTPERKTRRASGKTTGKQSARKGNVQARGDRSSSVSQNQSGIFQLVPPSETKAYGHVDGSVKPFSVLTSPTSSLPDLNTSAPPSVIFQQPFTDLQQVQLRAQIFVYGALIQGIAPEEAYMVSAFGGHDGGGGMWENAWRVSIERLQSQKSTPVNPETPLQSRSDLRFTGSRAPDQVIKQGAFQSKSIPSPLGRPSTKGTPPLGSPMIPISSPLWSISTPVCEGLQYNYQQALNPLHPFQTPPIGNIFGGHNTTWIPQASFRGPWLASSQSSAAQASTLFSAFPSTEAVQLTPVKETSLPQLPSMKHVSSGPSAQTGGPTSTFAGASPVFDPKKVLASQGEHSADPKPRKRKKTSTSKDHVQVTKQARSQPESVTMQARSQPESALTLAGSSSLSTSVAISTPSTIVSKTMPEKLIMSVFPMPSTGHLKKADQDLEQRATLSEETLSKVKEARQQAEEAAAYAAAAVSHSQEIWDQSDKQKNSRLILDVEAKLASAAAAAAAAAAVAKAAAAAANVASNAALQAKLMAEEALVSYNDGNASQSIRMATPVPILRGEDGTNSSTSILVAAREAVRRRVEVASAASKRAENMDAIVKAAELAAEAVSQAGIIVAMGDPLPLSQLVEAGPEGYWKVPQFSSGLVMKSSGMSREQSNLVTVGEDADTSVRGSKDGQSDKHEAQPTAHEKSPILREVNKESMDDQLRRGVGTTGFDTVIEKGSIGPKGRNVSEIISNSALITVENDFEKEAEASEESSIKEGSLVEVLKDGAGFGEAWFTAKVLCLQDGKACVCYTELQSDEGKLQEWVALEGEEDKPPKIRIARPVTALGHDGTRKRRRAAMADYTWSVGDKVDAWIQESWWEGVVTEKNKKDETILTVHFPAQGEKSVVKAWHLRPSLIWKDGKWVEWFSVRNDTSFLEGDMPQEKRPKLGGPAVEGKGEDSTSKGVDVVDSGKPVDPRLLNLSANETVFNMGTNTRTENKLDATRTIRTGLQKEGSRGVVFGIPKPGKKRKFMEVSKHYVENESNKTNETSDSVKFPKYLMPQGSRGLKNTSKIDKREKQVAESKLKGLRSGKLQSLSGKSAAQKDSLLTDARSASDGSSEMDNTGRIKDSVNRAEGLSGKHTLSQTTQGQIEFSSLAPSSDSSFKKVSTLTAKSRANKGKLAPAFGRLGKIEEGKVFSGNPAKSTAEVVEPRRSNRRIQPTSRLLEGLQSSLIISKIPSVSHDKGHRSQNRNASRGNNNG